MSTMVILDPNGEKTEALQAWVSSNNVLLTKRKEQVDKVRTPSSERILTTFADIKSKKASNTMQEERHWLRVLIPNFSRKDVRLYLGCSNCGKRCDCDKGLVFACSCNKKDCISTPKMNLNFDATDTTASMNFTAFTEDAERILDIEAKDLYDRSHEDCTNFLDKAAVEKKAE